MSEQIPAEIAEAIEKYGRVASNAGRWGLVMADQREAARAALDAVILKHIRGAALSQHEPSQTET